MVIGEEAGEALLGSLCCRLAEHGGTDRLFTTSVGGSGLGLPSHVRLGGGCLSAGGSGLCPFDKGVGASLRSYRSAPLALVPLGEAFLLRKPIA